MFHPGSPKVNGPTAAAELGAIRLCGEAHLSCGSLTAIIPLTMSNIKITHAKKTGGPSGIT